MGKRGGFRRSGAMQIAEFSEVLISSRTLAVVLWYSVRKTVWEISMNIVKITTERAQNLE